MRTDRYFPDTPQLQYPASRKSLYRLSLFVNRTEKRRVQLDPSEMSFDGTHRGVDRPPLSILAYSGSSVFPTLLCMYMNVFVAQPRSPLMRDIFDRKFRKLHRLIFGYVLHIPHITILRVHLYYISKRLKVWKLKVKN